MEGLLDRVVRGEGKDDKETVLKETVHVLYETTLLTSGYAVPNTMDFAKRIEQVIRSFVGVDKDAEAVVNLKPAPEKDDDEESKEEKKDDVEEVPEIKAEEDEGHDEL